MGSDKALEVIGALASYRGDNRCPACDGHVVEAVLQDGKRWFPTKGYWMRRDPTHRICTVCNWSQLLQIEIDYGASVSFTVPDRPRYLVTDAN